MGENDDTSGHDFLGKFTKFVDGNLRAVRAISWMLAGAGVFIILRRTYVFTWFKTASDVPAEFITKNISFRGQVRKVRNDNSLGVYHIPLFKGFRKSQCNLDSDVLSPASLLDVSLLGVEFREGSHKWLYDHVMLKTLHITPVRLTKEDTLECILYKKKSWFSSMCINEEMVQQGVAVACHVSALADNTLYNKLLRGLLKAEVKAEKKGSGIWVKPSWSEKLGVLMSSQGNKVKTKLSSVRKLFSKIH